MKQRKSVPTKGLHRWLEARWLYVMPDFERPHYSIIEWDCEDDPREPEDDLHREAYP